MAIPLTSSDQTSSCSLSHILNLPSFFILLSSLGVNVLFLLVLTVPSHCVPSISLLWQPACHHVRKHYYARTKRYLVFQRIHAPGKTCYWSVISIYYKVISTIAFYILFFIFCRLNYFILISCLLCHFSAITDSANT